ncbi:MAG: SDR family NAD(P)-dependent oxidoreductase [Actinomycetota bacterium]|nr:SDR family NAD(P)-dependent oxidoreductase [Actinomycetota bacterium]
MQIEGKIAVVTGGASGIGRALAMEFVARGAAGVVVADLDGEWAQKVAERIGGLAVQCDVGEPGAIESLVAAARARYGRVDIFCSNAGYSDPVGVGLDESMEAFERLTRVNMLAHVAAAKAVVPEMVERGGGYLLQTLSSAALISGPAAPGYTFTKFGALGFAEWMAVNYGAKGVRVSCLCPNVVYTGMFGRPKDLDAVAVPPAVGALGEVLLPEDVAVTVADAMEGPEPFLILPHPRVGESYRRKADDYEGWILRTRERLARMQAG